MGDTRRIDYGSYYVYIKPISQNSTCHGRLLAAASTVPATSHPISGGGGNCCLFFKDLFCYSSHLMLPHCLTLSPILWHFASIIAAYIGP